MNNNFNLQQNLMDEVYNKWNELIDQGINIDRLEVIEKYFTPKHKMAVQLGNMNYQVCNGGWSQWHTNWYGMDRDDLMEYCKKGIELKINHFDTLLNILTEIEDLGTPDMYDDVEIHECTECNGTGYIYEEDEEGNEIEVMCPECYGSKEWEEDISFEQVYCEMLSEFDDRYYNIDESEWLNSFQCLLEAI